MDVKSDKTSNVHNSVIFEARTFQDTPKCVFFHVDSKNDLIFAMRQNFAEIRAKNRWQQLSYEHFLNPHRSLIFLANATFLVPKWRPFHGDSKNSLKFVIILGKVRYLIKYVKIELSTLTSWRVNRKKMKIYKKVFVRFFSLSESQTKFL